MQYKFKMIYDIQVSSHIHRPTQRLLYKKTSSGQGSGYAKYDWKLQQNNVNRYVLHDIQKLYIIFA